MKPSVQKIVAKLAKEQEKKVKKVELASIQKIKADYKEIDSLLSVLENELRALRDAKKQAKSRFDQYESNLKPTVREAQDVLQKVKELGVQDNELEKMVSQLEFWEKAAKKSRDSLGL